MAIRTIEIDRYVFPIELDQVISRGDSSTGRSKKIHIKKTHWRSGLILGAMLGLASLSYLPWKNARKIPSLFRVDPLCTTEALLATTKRTADLQLLASGKSV